MVSQWHWDHECDPFSTEVILVGQSNPNVSSTISFYTVISPPQPGQRSQKQHVYDFDFFSIPGYKVLRYRTPNKSIINASASESQIAGPEIQTMFFDLYGWHTFLGCSSVVPNVGNVTDPEDVCADVYGMYVQNPYLFLSINGTQGSSSSSGGGGEEMFVRTVQSEYTYSDDAPSFTVQYANADESLTERLLLRSALTDRDNPNILKVCSNEEAKGQVLATLGFFLDALEDFAVYIGHPSLYFT